MERRDFLIRGGLALGAVATVSAPTRALAAAEHVDSPAHPGDWAWVRSQFDLLDPSKAYFAGFYLVSHPKSVRAAIETHRRGLDMNPLGYHHEHFGELEERVRAVAGEYLGVDGEVEIALTDSTTMGLAMLYTGLKLRDGQEILTSTHDHPAATHGSLRLRELRTGTKVVKVPLYAKSASATVDEMVGNVMSAIGPQTRVLALTWVHSCTGVKLPVRAVADAVAKINTRRSAADRVIFCVDGVHGLGIDDVTLPSLGCDFFAAGTHKWMFAPRGTGILWGKLEMWEEVLPTIPTFDVPDQPGPAFTPGGFHSYEHRWAAEEGFRLHMAIGKPQVAARLHELNGQMRQGLSKMPHVDLHTPVSGELSAGITCFDIKGKTPSEVIGELADRGIVGSVSPYTPSCARLACSLWNTEEEVGRALKAVGQMA
jgi:selenocysteine lyase/cysteine desulfurase